jgi:hypothetical protein
MPDTPPPSSSERSLIQKVKIKLRAAGVELDHVVKWRLLKTHLQPEGFHFTCDDPLALQRMAEKSRRMALAWLPSLW